jgi:hypothetical protein
MPDLKPAEAASSLRNLTTSRGISTDKASALRGLPTEITEHRSVEEIFLKWERQGFLNGSDETVDSTADEITDQKDMGVGEPGLLGVGEEASCTVPSCTETGIPGHLPRDLLPLPYPRGSATRSARSSSGPAEEKKANESAAASLIPEPLGGDTEVRPSHVRVGEAEPTDD